MAQITIPINYVDRNDTLTFCIYTMSQAPCTVSLRTDDNQSIFSVEKTNEFSNFQDITGQRVYFLGNLKATWNTIFLNVVNALSTPIQAQTTVSGILRNDGTTAGYVTNVCLEDQTDGDFQDIFITIGAFHKSN
ncbi:MAG: hypothetical protein J6V76_06410 [Bacteroidales bacterium]|nr:hypothetical protein [Bacteroidales bacterium]